MRRLPLPLLLLGLGACADAPTRPHATGPSAAAAARTATTQVVHVVYLVPADRVAQKVYTHVLERAIENLQIWYRDALGTGTSFVLSRPEVAVITTPHDAAWYATTPNGPTPSLWFWYNAVADGFALTGGSFFDPDDVWVYYIDADPACGQAVGATASVALLPANDLRGLAGQPTISPCTGQPEPDQGTCRWVGGLGHELGHALGLPHPPGCETGDPSCPLRALMWLGYITYPDAFLTADDRAALGASPFFVPVHLPAKLPDCTKVPGGNRTLVQQRGADGSVAGSAVGSPRGALRATAPAAPACPYSLLSAYVSAGMNEIGDKPWLAPGTTPIQRGRGTQ